MRSRRPSRRQTARWPSDCWRVSPRPRRQAATVAASNPPHSSSSNGTAATPRSRTSLVDLRVDDHETPIEELRRLYDLHDQLFGKTPRGEWLPVDDELRAEIGERLKKLGFERLQDWAGAANLEERVDGEDEIDPVVLNELRRST